MLGYQIFFCLALCGAGATRVYFRRFTYLPASGCVVVPLFVLRRAPGRRHYYLALFFYAVGRCGDWGRVGVPRDVELFCGERGGGGRYVFWLVTCCLPVCWCLGPGVVEIIGIELPFLKRACYQRLSVWLLFYGRSLGKLRNSHFLCSGRYILAGGCVGCITGFLGFHGAGWGGYWLVLLP